MTIWHISTGILALYALATGVLYWRRHMHSENQGQGRGAEGSLSQTALKNPLQQQSGLLDWQKTFDAIIDPVLVLNKDLSVVKGNKAAHKLFAPPDQSLEGQFCHQLFAGCETSCTTCPIQALSPYKPHVHQDIYQKYLGKTYSVSCAPIYQEQEIIGYIHSAKDITHQRQLEKQLIQAHKMDAIATLAGGIAHDFNNILGAILGNADLLLYRLPTEGEEEKDSGLPPLNFDEVAEHLHSIKRAGLRAKELVSQILAFSRQSTSSRQVMNIAPLIKENCKLLRASLPSTIELKTHIDDQAGSLLADPAQIQQAFMNLCNNAAQALEESMGTIEITLRETEIEEPDLKRYPELQVGRYVVLSVRDTGKGIPEDLVPRIFDPFFTTKDVGYGSGMGLAVIHGIILAHDGRIIVQSNQGKGSIFTIFFPRVLVEQSQDNDMMTSLPKGTETILFVDDEEEIVVMRTRMLEYLGYNVIAAQSGEEALSYLDRGTDTVHMLITDQTMPRMTGLQLARKVRQKLGNIPVILCSGYSDAMSPEETEKAGVDRFIAKPLDMRQLSTAIREILAHRKEESL